MPGVRDSVLSMMRFSKFSIDQPNSAIEARADHAAAALQRVKAAPQ